MVELGFEETDEGEEKLSKARNDGEVVKCVIMRCSSSKIVTAHVVPCKGRDEDGYVIDTLVKDFEWLGHTKSIFKADNEASLQTVLRGVIRRCAADIKTLDQITKEEPAKYESQSNGLTEVGILLIRGMFRTLRLCLESRLGKKLPVDHPVAAWLLEHCSLAHAHGQWIVPCQS